MKLLNKLGMHVADNMYGYGVVGLLWVTFFIGFCFYKVVTL